MKIDVYIDLYSDDIINNIKMIKENWLMMNMTPTQKGDNMDRLKVTIDLPEKYFNHKLDGYGTVDSIKEVE